MDLKDIFPEKPQFFLSATQKTYALRVPNLEDRARFRELLGGDQNIQKVFNELQWDVISKLVYRLLVEKEHFPASKEEAMDDDGVKVTRLITGPAALMRAVTKMDESTQMLGALITAIRNGDPLIDKAMSVALESEKKTLVSQTGDSSLTQSPASMDTLQNSLVS